MGPYQIIKNEITLGLIKVTRFCLNICDLWRFLHLWMNVQVADWMDVWVGKSQIIKSGINLKLFKII